MIARLVVTFGAVAVAAILGAIRVDRPEVDRAPPSLLAGEELTPIVGFGGQPPIVLSGAGLAPLAAVFFFVVVLGDARRVQRLRAFAPLVAAAGALPFAGYLALFFARTTPAGAVAPIEPGTLVAVLCFGSAALAGLGAVATRFGTGNGFLLVSVAAASPWDPSVLLGGVVLAPLFAVLVDRRQRLQVPGLQGPLAVTAAPGGLAGLALGPRLGVIPHAVLGPLVPLFESPGIAVALSLAGAAFFTFFGASLSNASYVVAHHAAGESGAEALKAEIERRALRATIVNAVVVTGLVGASSLLIRAAYDLAAAVWVGAALATLGLDVRDEARAPADLVELGEAPRLLEADRMRDVLAAAGIPSHVRCANGWQVLGGLWAFVPLPLLVRRADLERARAVLERDAPFLIGSPALSPPPPPPPQGPPP